MNKRESWKRLSKVKREIKRHARNRIVPNAGDKRVDSINFFLFKYHKPLRYLQLVEDLNFRTQHQQEMNQIDKADKNLLAG